MKAPEAPGGHEGNGTEQGYAMQLQEGYRLRNEIEGLFSRRQEPAAPKKAADLLQSHLISGFEAALDQGMHPADALAVMLSWAASELSRLGDQNRE